VRGWHSAGTTRLDAALTAETMSGLSNVYMCVIARWPCVLDYDYSMLEVLGPCATCNIAMPHTRYA
jgi:hypothetical protein